jgi:hypothetical protein
VGSADRDRLRRRTDDERASTCPHGGASSAAPSLTPRAAKAFLRAVRHWRKGPVGPVRTTQVYQGTFSRCSPGTPSTAVFLRRSCDETNWTIAPWLSASRGLICHAVPISLAVESLRQATSSCPWQVQERASTHGPTRAARLALRGDVTRDTADARKTTSTCRFSQVPRSAPRRCPLDPPGCRRPPAAWSGPGGREHDE